MEQDRADGTIIGTIQRVSQMRGGKGAFLKLRVAAQGARGGSVERFFEAVTFKPLTGFENGDRVKVEYRLESKKHEGCKDVSKDGSEHVFYFPQVVIEHVEVLEQGQPELPKTKSAPPPRTPDPGDDIPF